MAMLERLLIVVVLAVVVALAWTLGSALRRRRATGITAPRGVALAGRPQLLVFSTPGCADCRYRQKPAVEQVERELGEKVSVRHVDATEEPDLASAFGILTAPSTVVLDGAGRVAARNDGFAPAARLTAQLGPLATLSASA